MGLLKDYAESHIVNSIINYTIIGNTLGQQIILY